MSQEDYPVEFVLDSIDSIMATSKHPKVLLFDIGGVCVVSPFQGILDYEISHSIPPGWVNTCISRSAPNGYWHRLERGELPMDAAWFKGFSKDLSNPELWKIFYSTAQSKDSSLPSKIPPVPQINGEELFTLMMGLSRQLDPWMYPALKKLHESQKYVLAALSNTMIFPPDHPFADFPAGDIRSLFDIFVSSAHVGLRKPDPRIYELAFKEISGYVEREKDGKGKGKRWSEGVERDEVLFLDDIGENLKAGKKAGFQTVKVHLGRAFEAVDELERVTGLKLAGTHPKVAVKPVVKKELSKL